MIYLSIVTCDIIQLEGSWVKTNRQTIGLNQVKLVDEFWFVDSKRTTFGDTIRGCRILF